MQQIVCLSTSNWYGIPTRKQQVMGRIKDAEILYFEPPVTLIAPFKDKEASPRLSAYKNDGTKPISNITVYAMPPVMPFYNKYRSINKINQRRLASFVKSKMKEHGFENPILWVYHPSSVDAVDHIPHSSLIYDCVDRHAGYPGLIDPAVVNKMESQLAAKSNVVFATAKGLHDTLSQYNENTYLIPNGANYELFSRVDDPALPIPDDLFNIRKPVLGFSGALQECINYDYVAYAAKLHPEWSFVFIGSPLPGVDLSVLKGLPNIHLLGRKNYKDMVNYLAYFDVCLNIFKSGDLAKDVSPLKFYEYLATGKPIVSTPQPEQVLEYSDVVYIASTPEEFVEKCAVAIKEKSNWHTSRRRELGKASSWDSRVDEMRQILQRYDVI
ncbi:MAG: glycosyltransferase [Eubacteriales bacterium]|jgi:glycosyltransferase involved in cell wall biosynthesis